jgi:hypothetical protein
MWAEALQAVPSVVTAVTAIVAVVIAARGLKRWREEMIGRRRAEVAQEILADFYEARDIISWIRSPGSMGGEYEERAGREGEPEELRRHRDTYSVPLKRVHDHAEFFAKLQSRKYKAIAIFEVGAEEPYLRLNQIRSRIIVAAKAMMRVDPRREAREQDIERQQESESIIWEDYEEPDEVRLQVDEIVSAIERRFRKELSERAILK